MNSLCIFVLFILVCISGFYDSASAAPDPADNDSAVDQVKDAGSPTGITLLGAGYSWRRDGGAEREGAATPKSSEEILSWETGRGKSYLIPGLEIPSFLVLLNVFDRLVYPNQEEDGKKVYSSTLSSTWEHLRRQNWEFDKDPFNVNQFAHPYQGATMYGMARSAGLNFWQSLVYSNAGSFLWKMAGETDPPSINDMITTGNAGSLLGEALFRMSQLVLKEGGERPSPWRELGAAVVSPPTGLNRLAFGDRFKTLFPSHDPAVFWRFWLGESIDVHVSDVGSTLSNLRQAATADFSIAYGLPGKPGYSYLRPMDYFDFQITALAATRNPIESVMLRGLLLGKDYQAGPNYRGIWGLYGSYDYMSPYLFRVSTTAASLGTTAQWWLAPDLALQGSLLGGLGFGAAGTTPVASGQRDYHYGLTPQGLLNLRLLFRDRTMVDFAGREYYVSGAGSDNSRGSERIFRGSAGVTVRVYGPHSVGLQYVAAFRDAKYGNLPGKTQSEGILSLVYSYLGDSHLGEVEWRDAATY